MAYQFDNAVTMFGTTIDNALQERQNVGSKKDPKWEPKYTLTQLLRDDFRLPRPAKPEEGIKGLMSLPGVKVHRG